MWANVWIVVLVLGISAIIGWLSLQQSIISRVLALSPEHAEKYGLREGWMGTAQSDFNRYMEGQHYLEIGLDFHRHQYMLQFAKYIVCGLLIYSLWLVIQNWGIV